MGIYEQALKTAKGYYENPIDLRAALEDIFPELKESKDERIRKDIIEYLKAIDDNLVGTKQMNEWIAWVEKQKPIEWSNEDDAIFDDIILECAYVGDYPDYPNDMEREIYTDCERKIDWLKSLKQRITKQD